ncbi:MAG: DUF5700 domain-containing putative Zn-dependent protease [Nitrososphaerales archaeon]
MRNRTDANLERLVSMPGSRLAYAHHLWSSVSPTPTIEDFWKKELERIDWSEQLEASIEEIIQRLGGQERQWLGAVMRYLPRGHVFDTKIYLIGGYDNVVYGQDVALNLAFKQFHVDHREAVYYLIHELAHAGYFRYHRMPELASLDTTSDLLDAVRLLTHLEGMGVISPFKQRMKEGGLLDIDYKVLLNDNERNARVRDYFTLLARLENEPKRKLRKEDHRILDDFSARPKRLWYIAGGHMALKIEEKYGTTALRKVVMKGHEAFFKTYAQIENPLLV